ncbi:V-type ATP synthase subunit I [Ruminococcus albus]|uniref:V/A-type H+-transporting ATPase subunit I n=1 Tax=Ruminococcus albus TaxID=1264 RepID=A0A1I1K2B6_RUMAL|nr:V-type ATPase 116kDa subunit family protein [Ruminococcus albus]SFC54994.1 V/A-type H+-transporting ATPase subunit I [Ruminococcus albus]
MAIEKMALVNIIGRFEDLDETLIRCCDSGCFHIEPAFKNEANSTVKLLNEKNPFGVPLKEFASLATEMDIELTETKGTRFNGWTAEQFNELSENIDSEIEEKNSEKQKLATEVSELEGAVLQVDHLRGMNSDFSKIFACKHTACRIGRMPADNLAKLQYYDQTFFFVPFETTKDFCWGMYFCAEGDKELVDSIFRSMFFERIHLPDYVSGNTDEAITKLNDQIKVKKAEIEALDKEIAVLAEKHNQTILEAYTALKKRYDIFELRRKVGAVKEKFYVKGFVPKKQADKFSESFDDMEEVEVVLLPPDADAYCTPPTVLKNGWFTKPYAMLVEMYGLPKYNGFNPTAFVAITYTLLFGIMFGDLGQGFLLFILGLIIGGKVNKQAGGIVTRCGLSSMIFGTLYGSVFGFEELLDPVYENLGIDFLPLKAFEQSSFILLTAVGIGIFLIVVSMMLNIYIGFREKNYEKAVFGCNGIAGLIFYGSLVTYVVSKFILKIELASGAVFALLLVIPGICIFCRVPFAIATKYKKWKLSEEEEDMTVGGFIVENFFEMFEFLLSYVSNTMSFLRVGGFVLSHAGMMLVVMTLLNMSAAAAKPFTLVIGNLFVMAMEGMIVAIQIIRLEFYEIFSRFYESDGKEFEPLSVSFDTEVNI